MNVQDFELNKNKFEAESEVMIIFCCVTNEQLFLKVVLYKHWYKG